MSKLVNQTFISSVESLQFSTIKCRHCKRSFAPVKKRQYFCQNRDCYRERRIITREKSRLKAKGLLQASDKEAST